MKRNKFRKYFAFSKAGILDGFAYKFSALGWLLGDIISLLILFFLWQAIYKNSPNDVINGMTFKEMIAYLIYARVATSLVFSTISFWIIGDDIYEGNIAISLIRPINYRYRLLASSFGGFSIFDHFNVYTTYDYVSHYLKYNLRDSISRTHQSRFIF